MKKFLFSFLIITGIITKVSAIYISEIMYNPDGSDTGREWVEIFNDTGSDVNLTSYKLFEANTNHGISAYSSSTAVSANGYAVVVDNPAKFLIDYPDYNGVLYDSAFSLSNSGELLILKTSSGVQVDSVNYSPSLGGDDDKSTLSLVESSWTRGRATPGSENIFEEKTSVSTLVIEPKMSAPSADILLVIPEEKIVVAGADSEFSVKAVTQTGRKNIEGLNYSWSFGDGGHKVGKTVSYHYFYPGVYTSVVEVESDSYVEKGRIKVKVINPEINILGFGTSTAGFYLDVKNNNNLEVDLSNWVVEINLVPHVIPKNTFISGKSTTRLSGNALSIATSTDVVNARVRLLFPDHSEMTRYLSSTTSDQISSVIPAPSVVIPVLDGAPREAYSRSGGIQVQGLTHSDPNLFTEKPKSFFKPKTEMMSKVSTTSTSTKISQNLKENKKDTRLVSWFREKLSWVKF